MKTSPACAVALLLALATAGTAGPPVTPFEAAGPATPRNKIDELVFARLQDLGLQPARPCSDAVFLRRVHLDVIGTLPTADEARAFLRDKDPDKRAKLIDALLARPEYADYWSMKWCDLLRVKSEFPINLWPNAVQAYHRWVRASLRDNVPCDRFARDLLTSSGSNFRVPPVNFYRAVQSREPVALAQAAALTFLGVRQEAWPKERWADMAAFFSQVGAKPTAEWKEEIIFHDLEKAASAPAVGTFPDGSPAAVLPGQDPRVVFADWLLRPGNPYFARALANRVWAWLLGRGIVHEPDDFRPDNPPSNPELLAYLERELTGAKFDLKHLCRLILNSATYQLSSIPPETASEDKAMEAAANFASYPVRRLEAEVLIDALNQITGTTEKYTSIIPEPYTFIPEQERSIALADASISSSFLEMFGRSSRDTGLQSERSNKVTAQQRLHLLNSSHVQRKIEQGPWLRTLTTSGKKPMEILEDMYLTVLSRYPTEQELLTVASFTRPAGAAPGKPFARTIGGGGNKPANKPGAAAPPAAPAATIRPGVDMAWALINSAEFQLRH